MPLSQTANGCRKGCLPVVAGGLVGSVCESNRTEANCAESARSITSGTVWAEKEHFLLITL